MSEPQSVAWTKRMESVFGLHLRPTAHSPQGDLSSASLGAVSTFHIAGNPQALQRTNTAIGHAVNAPVKVCAVQSGTMLLVRENEQDLYFRPGEIAIYDTGRPYQLHFDGQWNCAVMTVAREELSLPNRVLNSALRQSFPSPGAGTVLTQLIEASIGDDITGTTGPASQQSSEFLGHAAIDLLAGLVYGKAAPYAPDEALRIAVFDFIRENLSDPQLSNDYIAGAHGISVRTLHRLFENEEWGVAELIRNWRLEAVYEDLQDPRFRDLTILSIGARHGIGNQAQLTRLFRAKYGITPGAFRREHGSAR